MDIFRPRPISNGMNRRANFIKIFTLFVGDLLFFWMSLFLNLYFRYYYHNSNPDWSLIKLHLIPFAAVFAVWLIIFGASGLYDLHFTQNTKRFFYRLLRAITTNVVLAIIIFYLILPYAEIEPRRNLFIIAFFATALIAWWRYIFNLFIIKTNASRIIFFGVSKETAELAKYLLKNPQLGQRPTAFIINGKEETFSVPSVATFRLEDQNISSIVRDKDIDTIIISREIKENKILAKVLFQVIPLGVGVIEFTTFHEMMTGKIPLSLIGEVWFLENLVGIKKKFYEFFKRLSDLIVAALISLPAAAVFPLIALAIKLNSPGPVFYKQQRVGRNGKVFWLIKYRSMIKNADQLSGFKKIGSSDPRQTAIGSFLRKFYLDELPQIVNILRGEMSLVGPRPERPEYIEGLKEKIPFYETRLLVEPGLTGWAQVNMEDDASVEDAPEKMQYDLYYIKNRSFILDLLIALRTIAALLKRQGR